MNRSFLPGTVGLLALAIIVAFGAHSASHPAPRTSHAAPPSENPGEREHFEFLRTRSASTGQIPPDIRRRELRFLRERFPAELSKSADDFQWRSRGPFNVGGRTRALALDVTNENVLLAGGVSGGLWRSEDGGRTWTKTTDPSLPQNVTALVQDVRPAHAHKWFLGTGERVGSTDLAGGGVFRSEDGGRSWTPLPSSPTRPGPEGGHPNVQRLLMNPDAPGDAGELYAATDFGIYRTRDGGASWQLVTADTAIDGHTDIARADSSGVFYAIRPLIDEFEGRVLRSDDGETWTDISPDNWSTLSRRALMAIAPSNENMVYFVNSRGGLWLYTYLSGDGSGAGGRWEDRSAQLKEVGFKSQSGYSMTIAVHPRDPDVVFLGGVELDRSIDGFRTSENAGEIGRHLNHHVDQHAIVFKPSDPNVMYSAHDGGVSRTDDALAEEVEWESLERGYVTSQFYAVAIDHSSPGDSTLIGGMQDNGTYFVNSNSERAEWKNIAGGDGGFAAIARDKEYYYVSTQGGFVLREVIDAGGEREDERGKQTRIDPPGATRRLFPHPFVLNPANTNQMFYAGESIWRNDDLAGLKKFTQGTLENWRELKGTSSDFEFTTAMEMSTRPANRLYYVREHGRMFRLDDANGGNPQPVEISSLRFPDSEFLWMNSIAADRRNADYLLVCFSNYEAPSIFFSDDGGRSWVDVSGNLEAHPDGSGGGPSVRWVEILNYEGQRYYFAATSVGVFYTTRLFGLSTKWQRTGADTIGNVPVDMITSRNEDGFVVVATHGNGVYSTNVGTPAPVAAAGPADLPAGIELSQNIPNPFRGSTRIGFTLDRPASVSLTVYDMAGRQVDELLRDERLGAGRHDRVWNAGTLPSGRYVYRLRAGERVEVKVGVVSR